MTPWTVAEGILFPGGTVEKENHQNLRISSPSLFPPLTN